MFDVGDEFVFNAGSVMLQSEDKAWKPDAGEIEKRHFDGGKWVAERKEDKEDGKEGGIDGLSEKERGGTFEIVDGLAAFVDDAWHGFEAGVEENEFGNATSGIGAVTDGDRNVGLFHGKDVVDAVAGHGNSISLFFEGFDEIFFLGWGDTRKNSVILNELRVIFGFKRGKVDAAEVFDAYSLGNGSDRSKIVAGDDFDGDVVIVKVVDDGGSSGANFVFETNDAK